jgi:histone-lysine N-methyltransferase SETMAR
MINDAAVSMSAPSAFGDHVAIADDVRLPDSIAYIERSEIPEAAYSRYDPAFASASNGCGCAGPCTDAACPCLLRNGGVSPYDAAGRLVALLHGDEVDQALTECGPGCACGWVCGGAVSAQGLRRRVRLERRLGAGVAAVAAERIPRASFVCEYAGEYLTREEASARLRRYDGAPPGDPGHALLVIREVLPSGASLRVSVDATRRRNAAGFFNHRCQPPHGSTRTSLHAGAHLCCRRGPRPGCARALTAPRPAPPRPRRRCSCDGGSLALVLIHSQGVLVPRVALFARRDILPGEELTFSYGPPNPNPRGRRCTCANVGCLGYLPAEPGV